MHPESKNCERSSELASTPWLITSQLIMSQRIERLGGVIQIDLEHMEPQDSLTETTNIEALKAHGMAALKRSSRRTFDLNPHCPVISITASRDADHKVSADW